MSVKGNLLCVTIILLFHTQGNAQTQHVRNANLEVLKSVSSGIELFGFSLLFNTAMVYPDNNIVMSPFSVWAMLTILSEGAGNHTQREMQLVLKHPNNGDINILRNSFKRFYQSFNVKTGTIQLDSTNFIYADMRTRIKDAFKNLLSTVYDTHLIQADFRNPSTAYYINKNVRDATNGRISEIVTSDDTRDAKMLLLNAIFFHGQWTMPFNVSETQLSPFHNEKGVQIGNVNMMHNRQPFPYVNSKAFKSEIIEIPYGKENRLSMVVVIPRKGVRLEEVYRILGQIKTTELFNLLKMAADEFPDDEIDFYMPKFSTQSEFNLNTILNGMGLYQAFYPQYANFSGLADSNELYLSRVIHKAQIEVNEEGTVASAVTGLLCISTILLVFTQLIETQILKKTERDVSTGIEGFGFSLLFRTAILSPNDNVVMSPFSVWAMMTVLSEGASGYTEKELRLALKHPDLDVLRDSFKKFEKLLRVRTSTVQLETTNFIYADIKTPINRSYRELIKSTYTTDIVTANFQDPRTTMEINSRVKSATQGRITEIVTDDDVKNAQMLLLNAIFFHGQWTMPFNVSETRVEPFYDENAREIGKVDMMFNRQPYPYFNSKEFGSQIIEIPYGKENRLSMIVVIPKKGIRLGDVYRKFTEVHINVLFEKLQEAADEYPDDEVDFYMPRFSTQSDFNLNTVLNHMGIHEVFDPQYADLSKLSRDSLHLSRVIHKAQISVNEEGTVASAVTVGELSNRNTPPKVMANKPFFYFIVEKTTNALVFGGTYVNPGK